MSVLSDVEPGEVERALRAYLEAHYVIEDPLAPAALALARRLDRDGDSLSGMAAAMRSLDLVVGKLRPEAADGAGVLDVLQFLRAVRRADPDVAAQIKALLRPDVLDALKQAKYPTAGSIR